MNMKWGRCFYLAALSLFVAVSSAFSETVVVSGKAFLKDQTTHSAIKIVFERKAPSALRDSVYTTDIGSFTKTLETGIYDVTYSKSDYFPYHEPTLAFYQNSVLNDVTLVKRTSLIRVPSVFASIQSAIDASSPGDTVLVDQGFYYENINFHGKKITVASHFLTTGQRSYISQTVIDGSQNGHAVEFSSGEDSSSLLYGFTVTHGNAVYTNTTTTSINDCGGGIYCANSSPTLSNLRIVDNTADGGPGAYGKGAGIYFDNSSSLIENTLIDNNVSNGDGGGIYMSMSNVTAHNLVIKNNTSVRYGPAVYLSLADATTTAIVNCTIIANATETVTNNAAVYGTMTNVDILNTIVSGHTGIYGVLSKRGVPNILNSSFTNNEKGAFFNCGELLGQIITRNVNNTPCDAFYNIYVDCRFVYPLSEDYHLDPYSPCIGAGTKENAPTIDFEGNPRGILPDIGAYENPLQVPPRAPVFVTKTLPDATESSLYTQSLTINDPDDPDTLHVELLQHPSWLTLDAQNRLTGTPRDADTGNNFPVVIRVHDLYNLADTLTTTINVININNPPVFLSKALPFGVAGEAYKDTLYASDADKDDIISFRLLSGPEWLTVSAEGYVDGSPTYKDVGRGISAVLIAEDSGGLADTLSVKFDIIALSNIDAFISFDTNLSRTGCQENYTIDNPGPDQYFGFAIYINNSDVLRSFRISITWDSNTAIYKPSRSGPNIPDDEYTFNGIPDAEFTPEKNILVVNGGEMSSIVEADESGKYKAIWAKMGGDASTLDSGLIYQVVFKTTSTVTINDIFSVTAGIDVYDDEGNHVGLGEKTLTVGRQLRPPYQLSLSDLEEDHGHKLMLSWSPSPDEDAGLVSYYRIFRSRSPKLYETRDISEFEDVSSLLSADVYYAVMIDSVAAGTTIYFDMGIPLTNTQYYYWMQAVGKSGESKKIAADAPVVVSNNAAPVEFSLKQPFPNPFNPSTTITFTLPSDCSATLSVYDITGRKIRELASGMLSAGTHSQVWDGTDDNGLHAASGVYFARLAADGKTAVEKMLLVK